MDDGLLDASLSIEQVAVLRWGAANRRDLPWRRTRDPWAILVAEVMLAQTQVDRVVPKWEAFLARWPDAELAAAAPLAEVLGVWQGLGYPRRAKYLHSAARTLTRDHGGRVPDELDSLLGLPGVGRYTARAVLAFAFEVDAAVVDTNIGRMLARRAGARLTPSAAQRAADDLVPAGRGWAWNQAVLDLGALLCRPKDPGCARCPLAATCAWRAGGLAEPDPAVGSAAVSRPQRRFDGSLRQARGSVLRSVQEGPVRRGELVDASGTADGADRVSEAIDSLVADGLAHVTADGLVTLPQD